jgi:hypothetical protein
MHVVILGWVVWLFHSVLSLSVKGQGSVLLLAVMKLTLQCMWC